jgi:hypothetical protein
MELTAFPPASSKSVGLLVRASLGSLRGSLVETRRDRPIWMDEAQRRDTSLPPLSSVCGRFPVASSWNSDESCVRRETPHSLPVIEAGLLPMYRYDTSYLLRCPSCFIIFHLLSSRDFYFHYSM